ncbi:MAG: TPM domain-containing protein [Nanoarchaeota archaeon]|nr:TPM domain-containing protein [Nanoarchaeota archaeon]
MRLAYLITVLLILQSAIALAPEDAKIEYFVNDYAGLLTYDEISYIEPLLKEIYDSGNAEFAIVIVDTLEGHDIQGYSQIVADGNIGDPEKDNGLVLLISKEDRSYFFAVGRGLEPSLPDSVVGRVGRQYLVPNFKEGKYSQGIYCRQDLRISKKPRSYLLFHRWSRRHAFSRRLRRIRRSSASQR